ncbi:hypothetical protein XENTR_v10021478 [Xenopus tropicalis]|uniref:Purple acid phosphatase n=1 Tax=Xenopus tropicalis TaxID=8364 RepID=A0A8J1IL21_XENTR|nr:acid phosphatase type 7 isoform X1 [Xenopus tropicalis]XP_031746128.1 acid phosphatase type 7 isoform X1 [Xenopus tropicalis]KAE8585857.1 hypothetical protein XENTR_v10021478 [Xenopus tropicalis]
MLVLEYLPVLLVAVSLGQSAVLDKVQPEQVHLSYTGDPLSMTVTWTTFAPTPSVVKYSTVPGPLLFNISAYGNATQFVDGGFMKRKMFIHRVTLKNLTPTQRYVYHCGSDFGWSPQFYFRAMQTGSSWGPRLAVFGDMGNENAQSLPRLQKETQMDMYDVILHVGDFAYDLDKDNAQIGDKFMRQVESVAAYLPYMTCPGNHEEAYNFSNYRNRFSMPGTTEGLWYSWNLGPAHIISLSTEVYFFINYGKELLAEQYRWLQKDLEEANKPSNRLERPWIITMGHRPMYCSNFDKDDCLQHDTVVRTGIFGGQYGLEDLFYKYGVDLEIWAHEHSYERLWPVYNYTVYKGSSESPYTNPLAPVHIITGSAGCNERLDPFFPLHREWSALRIEDYGYTRIHIANKTHIHLQQVSDDQNGEIVDDFWLIKDKR